MAEVEKSGKQRNLQFLFSPNRPKHSSLLLPCDTAQQGKMNGTTRNTFFSSSTDLKCTCNTAKTDYSNKDFGHSVVYKEYVLA